MWLAELGLKFLLGVRLGVHLGVLVGVRARLGGHEVREDLLVVLLVLIRPEVEVAVALEVAGSC